MSFAYIYAQSFTYQSAIDFITLFTPIASPINADKANICEDKECQGKYQKLLKNAKTLQDDIIEAKKTLFVAMLENPNPQMLSRIYLALASLAYKEGKFYYAYDIYLYLKAYQANGGDIASIDKNLAFIFKSYPISLESLFQAYFDGVIDTPFFAQGYLPLIGKKYTFFGTQEKLTPNKQESQADMNDKPNQSKPNTQCFFVLGLGELYCSDLDSMQILPFEWGLYYVVPHTIYYLKSNALHIYATIKYQTLSKPFICDENKKIADSSSLQQDLLDSGMTQSRTMIQDWEDGICGNDVFMKVEYIGKLDVFNDTKKVPVVITNTHLREDSRHKFYEAFSLESKTMQEDLSLSHPSMNIQGRIPNLFFINYQNKIVGCVLSDDKKEEKVFSFSRNSTPTLLAHNSLTLRFKGIQKHSNYIPQSPSCIYKDFCDDALLYFGNDVLSSLLKRHNTKIQAQWLKDLEQCNSDNKCLQTKIKEYILTLESKP